MFSPRIKTIGMLFVSGMVGGAIGQNFAQSTKSIWAGVICGVLLFFMPFIISGMFDLYKYVKEN